MHIWLFVFLWSRNSFSLNDFEWLFNHAATKCIASILFSLHSFTFYFGNHTVRWALKRSGCKILFQLSLICFNASFRAPLANSSKSDKMAVAYLWLRHVYVIVIFVGKLESVCKAFTLLYMHFLDSLIVLWWILAQFWQLIINNVNFSTLIKYSLLCTSFLQLEIILVSSDSWSCWCEFFVSCLLLKHICFLF